MFVIGDMPVTKTAVVFQKIYAQKNRMKENAPKTNIGLNVMVVLKIIVKPENFASNAWRVMNAVQIRTNVFAMMDMHEQTVRLRPRLCKILLHIT